MAPFSTEVKKFSVVFELNGTILNTYISTQNKESIQKTLDKFVSENGNKIHLLSCKEATQ